MIRRVRRAIAGVSANRTRSFPRSTTSALSHATSVPEPIATPTVAAVGSWEVVNAVADVGNNLTACDQFLDSNKFPFGKKIGFDIGHA